VQSQIGGGESLVRGVADGVSGLITAPIKEARMGGIGGFFKGVGKGIVGVVVKPIVGVGDAVVSVIQGSSQQAQVRPSFAAHTPTGAVTVDSRS
jgi:vacuolar protein sorting-associated protein 13A/C